MEKIWIILLGVAGIIIVCLLNRKNTVFRTVGCIAVLLGCVMGLLIYFNVSYFESVRTIVLTITLTVILLVLVYMILIVAGNYIKRKQAQSKRSFQASEKPSAAARRKAVTGHRRQAEAEAEGLADAEPAAEQPIEATIGAPIAEVPPRHISEIVEETAPAALEELTEKPIEAPVKKAPVTKEETVRKDEPLYAAGGKPQPDEKEGGLAMSEDKSRKTKEYKLPEKQPAAMDDKSKVEKVDAADPGVPAFDVFLEPRADEDPVSLVERPATEETRKESVSAETPAEDTVEALKAKEEPEVDKFTSFETFLLPDVDEETGINGEEPAVEEEQFGLFEFADDEEMREESEKTEEKLSVSLDDAAARFAQWQSEITEEEEPVAVMEDIAELPTGKESDLWEVPAVLAEMEELPAEEEQLTEVYGEAEVYEPESGAEEKQSAAKAADEQPEDEITVPMEEWEELEEGIAMPGKAWEEPESETTVEPEAPVEPEPEAPEEPEIQYGELDPHQRKQAEMGELRKLVVQKDYDAAIQQVFKILNAGYVMTPDEKQQMKLILLTLKEKTRR